MLEHVGAKEILVAKRVDRRDKREQHYRHPADEPSDARKILPMRDAIGHQQCRASNQHGQIRVPRSQYLSHLATRNPSRRFSTNCSRYSICGHRYTVVKITTHTPSTKCQYMLTASKPDGFISP